MNNIYDYSKTSISSGKSLLSGGLIGCSILPILTATFFVIEEGEALPELLASFISLAVGIYILRHCGSGKKIAIIGIVATLVGFLLGVVLGFLIFFSHFHFWLF